MAWVCDHRATNEDYKKLEKIYQYYAEKYADWKTESDWTAEEACDIELNQYWMTFGSYPEWKYSMRRAIKNAIGDYGIAWGYVGHSE